MSFKKEHSGDTEFAKSLFSEMVTVTGPAKMMFLAGIGAEDEDDPAGGVRYHGDPYAQSVYAFDKAKRLLAKHGATFADVIKITAYLTDVRDRQHYQNARLEAMKDIPALPAHTFLVVSALARPGMVMEIDIIAAVPA